MSNATSGDALEYAEMVAATFGEHAALYKRDSHDYIVMVDDATAPYFISVTVHPQTGDVVTDSSTGGAWETGWDA